MLTDKSSHLRFSIRKKEYKMNKLLAITSGLLATGSVVAEFSAPALHVDAKVEFNTAHIYEGRRLLDQSFAPDINVGIPLLDDAGNLYVGVGASLGVQNKSFGNNDVTPYVGFSYDITDMFTVDIGYTLHNLDKKPVMGIPGLDISNFSNFKVPFVVLNSEGGVSVGNRSESVEEFWGEVLGRAQDAVGQVQSNDEQGIVAAVASELQNLEYTLEGKKRFHEIYAGIMADVLLNPALYFSYDFTQKKANINGVVHYTFDLSSCGVAGVAIDLGGKVGYTRVKKPYGIAHDTKVSFLDLDGISNEVSLPTIPHMEGNLFNKTSWFYAGVNADLVYSLNENAKARAGVAFSYNSANKDSWINAENHKKHNVWFSSAVEFSF
jgi:hypothetical protein